MINILKSISILSAVAAVAGFAFTNIIGFWQAFAVAVVLQIIIGSIVESFKLQKFEVEELYANTESILSKSDVEVECPCGKSKQSIYLFVNDPFITLECPECKNKFRVVLNVSTQLVTEPVNLDQMYGALKEKQFNENSKIGTSL